MNDEMRRQDIYILSEWYSPQDLDVMIAHMPTEITDASGTLYREYVTMLEDMFALRGELHSPEELQLIVNGLKLKASKFGYPTNQLELYV